MVTFDKHGLGTSMMQVIDVTDEDFLNYKKASMIIAMPSCTFKCCKDAGGLDICHNKELAKSRRIDIFAEDLIRRYQSNIITKAIVFAGLEPLYSIPYDYATPPYHPDVCPEGPHVDLKVLNEYKSSLTDVLDFIYIMRNGMTGVCEPCYDDIIIYTGYTKDECNERGWIEAIRTLGATNEESHIIMKFGRFVPGQNKHLDPVLGVKLASDNQFAEVII